MGTRAARRLAPAMFALGALVLGPGGRASAAPTAGAARTVVFNCARGARLTAVIDGPVVTVTDGEGRSFRLNRVDRGQDSRFLYEGDGASMRSRGVQMTWVAPGKPPLHCRSAGPGKPGEGR